MRDIDGQRLFPGDRVEIVGAVESSGLNGRRFVVKGPAKINAGSIAERTFIKLQIESYGFKIEELVDLCGLGWAAGRMCRRIGTTFEAADKSFKQLLAEL